MRLAPAIAILLIASAALAVGTSTWTHTSEADFSAGTFEQVVATNLGDLKLSRAVKTLLEQDPQVSAVYSLAEGKDGVIYAGTGPNGVLLKIKDGTVSHAMKIDKATNLQSLVALPDGGLLVGTIGEEGKVYKIDNPAAKEPKAKEIFKANGVQYIWSIVHTPDESLYLATGPNGQLFEVSPEGKQRLVFDSEENNLTAMAWDGKDKLYIGTDPNGLIYRVDRRTGQSFVLYDAGEAEISSILIDAKGNIIVATGSAQEGAPGTTPAAGEPGGRPEGAGAGGPIAPGDQPKEPPTPPKLPDPTPGQPRPIPKSPGALLPPSVLRGDGAELKSLSAMPRARISNPFSLQPSSVSLPNAPLEYRGREAWRLFHNVTRTVLLSPNAATAPSPAMPKPKPGPKPAPGTQPAIPSLPGFPMPDGNEGPGASAAQGNAIYRIDQDGFVTEIFRQNLTIYAVVEHAGSLFVATGGEGKIFQIRPDAEETVVIAKVDPKEVIALLPAADGSIYLGLANAGGIASMSSGYATRGTFTSPVMDATQISRFGKLHLDGLLPDSTGLTVATRSGNVKDPTERGWSAWSAEMPAAQYLQTPSPSARFLQYRLTLTSKDAAQTPIVENVSVAYQVPNLSPVIRSIKVQSADAPASPVAPNLAALAALGVGGGAGEGAGQPAGGQPGNKTPPSHRLNISWEASDPNNDALSFGVYFRPAGSDVPWITLKEKQTEATFEWDSQAVADGKYQVRVTASDAAANVPGTGKTATRVTETVTVDHTAPVIGDVQTQITPKFVRLSMRIADRLGTVASAEYSVDSAKDWQAFLPSDTIWDSPEETASFDVTGLPAGAHQITIRATDSAGNVAYETVQVTVGQPTAKK